MRHRTPLVLALGSLLIAVTPGVAHAHADVVRTSPRNGSVVATAPKAVTVTFSEPVELDSARLIGADGVELASSAVMSGAVLTLTAKAPLSGQRTITAAWTVTSDDGHQVNGSSAFMVGQPPEIGPPVALTTTPAIPATLRGQRIGRMSVTFASKASSGQIQWTSAQLPEPLNWQVTGRKGRATASGVLPFAGPWTMQATLVSANGAVMVVRSRVEVAR
ncbi:MAG: copper resistance protein CopC [Actinomycetales bacterium]|nr:copper resistance protein CopC [Actinomycetales bacterium]